MTKKQEKIIQVALELFARQGYANTSTSKIAKEAGVSEGLIFRHFESKEGLLNALINMGLENKAVLVNKLKQETDPRKLLNKAFDLPLELLKAQKEYWKLQFSLKHQSPEIAKKYMESDIIESLHQTLFQAFEELNYEKPKQEVQLLFMIITNMFYYLETMDEQEQNDFVDFVKSKYKL